MKLEEEIAKKFPLIITEEDVKYHTMNRLGFLRDYVKEISIHLNGKYELMACAHLINEIDDIDQYPEIQMMNGKPVIIFEIGRLYTQIFNTSFGIYAYKWPTCKAKRSDIILSPCEIFRSTSNTAFPITYKLYPQSLISDLTVLLTKYGVTDFYKYEIIPNDFDYSYMISLNYRIESESGKEYISDKKKSKLRAFIDEYGKKGISIRCDKKAGYIQVCVDVYKIISRNYGRVKVSAIVGDKKEVVYFLIEIRDNTGYLTCIMNHFAQIEKKRYQNEDVASSLSTIKDIVKLINDYKETKDERKDQLITTQSGINQFDNRSDE